MLVPYMRNDFKVGQRVRRVGFMEVGTVTEVAESYVTVDFDGPGFKQGYFPAHTMERVDDSDSKKLDPPEGLPLFRSFVLTEHPEGA